MPIPASILERIETFRRNLDSYLKPDYKEAQVRQEFIDPLFAALGWDVSNTSGYAEAYKDVVHEDSLRIPGVGTKAPDYSFRIGGTRKFFVEAKKPSVYLKDNPEPALQLRIYSFSAELALGIVTDFQEFAIYETRFRPKATDKAAVGRIFYCTYEEYPEKWDEIAAIFSREAVLLGAFDKHAAATRGKRGTTEFDAEFLKDMEHWRDLLARNLALRNAALTQRELNFAVQRILDRIVFLRIAEDRGIESYGQLQALTAGPKIYPRLREIFERADFRYYKLNAFDWAIEFQPIMDAGGFDAVIGNPPYVRIQGFPPEQIAYFSSHYRAATGNYDLYVNFVEQGLVLLKKDGGLGFILPNKFIKTDYGIGLRRFVSEKKFVSAIVDFGANQVFGATTYTCLLHLEKRSLTNLKFGSSEASADALARVAFRDFSPATLGESPWSFESADSRRLLAKLTNQSRRLLDLPAEMSRGSSTGNDEVFVVSRSDAKGLEEAALRAPLYAQDFNRYEFHLTHEWRVIFPYDLSGGDPRLMSAEELKSSFPKAFAHLQACQSQLQKRKQFREWYGYSAARNLNLHNRAQIAVPLLANKGMFALIPESQRTKICPMASGGFTISLSDRCGLRPEFVLALLNSRLLFWVLENLSNVFRGGWITCTKQYFGELPIKTLDLKSKPDRAAHDHLVTHVERMLKLHADLAAAKSPDAQTHLQRDIAATDRAIDQLVYQLYDLTPAEIALVEQATSPVVAAPEVAPMDEILRPPPPRPTYAQAEADAAHHFLAKEDPAKGE